MKIEYKLGKKKKTWNNGLTSFVYEKKDLKQIIS